MYHKCKADLDEIYDNITEGVKIRSKCLFKSLFERTDQIDKLDHNTLLPSTTLPSVTNDQKVVCDNDLTDKELSDALKGIPNNKSLGNDGL